MVLCGANAYEQKYYLNPDFEGLPSQIKDELQIMCVLYTAEIGGIFTVEFNDDGKLLLKTNASENDFTYDEIGSELKIKQLMNDKQELFRSLELYYRIFIDGDVPEELLKE
ncbi:MAG: DUF6145 family protein [Candidatus Alectryocaccobium sp.]|jgi:hypothetical protein|nr:DUF6145 family protein [Lachnospiraceae bacterium]MDY6221772.1 DUF6145 family protein [Candidatus Alectryocaccobium sp.]